MLFKSASTYTDRSILIKGQTVSAKGNMIEISTGGVVVISPLKASAGTRVELVFEIPALEYFRTISCHAIVTQLEDITIGFRLVIKFEALPSKEYAFITDFLDYKDRLARLGKKLKTPRSF